MILCITSGWWDAIADTGTAIATIFLVIVAIRQLSKLNTSIFTATASLETSKDSNRISNLMNVLEHEAEISGRKSRLDEISYEIEEYSLNNPQPDDKVKILRRKLDSAIEDYLNSIDRLAFCIKNDYFPEKDWKREYRKVIENVVDNYEDWFGAASNYVNVIDLNNKWKRE